MRVCIRSCACVCVSTRVSACGIVMACVQFWVCANVRVCMHESVLVNAAACKYVSECMRVSACGCVRACEWVRACGCARACVWVRACKCVRVHANTHASVRVHVLGCQTQIKKMTLSSSFQTFYNSQVSCSSVWKVTTQNEKETSEISSLRAMAPIRTKRHQL